MFRLIRIELVYNLDMNIDTRKQQFLNDVTVAVKKDSFLTSNTIGISFIGSVLGNSWNPANSDIDIICYTKKSEYSFEAFQRILHILKDINAIYKLYPESSYNLPAQAWNKISEVEEYLFIIPFHFIGFHIMVFSKQNFDFKTGKSNNLLLKFLTNHLFPPAIFIESIFSEHQFISGKDIVSDIKLKAPKEPGVILNLPNALLMVGLPLALISPNKALGWIIKASRAGYRNCEHLYSIYNKKVSFSDFEKKHMSKTLSLKKNFYHHLNYSRKDVLKYWYDSRLFLKGLKGKVNEF